MSGDRRPKPLQDINRAIRAGDLEAYPSTNTALGMRPVEFSRGASQWIWQPIARQALNAFGTIQGGYWAVFLDEAMATAVASVLEDGEWAVSAEIKLSYLRSATDQTHVKGQAKVIKRSRTLAFLEAHASDHGGRVLVSASATFAIGRQDPAT